MATIVVETLALANETLVEFVERTGRELKASGHKFRTQEEIDAELDDVRSGWDDQPQC